MRFPSNAVLERKSADSAAAKKRSHRRWLAPLLSLGLAPLLLLASPGTASAQTWCFSPDDHKPHILKGDTTWARPQQQANNTWQDWVWRGPAFQCPWNVPGCTYAWGQSKTTGWSWSVSLSVTNPVPYLNKVLGSITPEYGRNGSTSTSFTFTTQLKPGQTAQPIHIVDRRWVSGDFVGAFRTDGSLCDGRHPTIYRYWWDGDYAFGHWETNIKVGVDRGSYNVW